MGPKIIAEIGENTSIKNTGLFPLLKGHIQTILEKINVIMTLGGRGSRIMTLIGSALLELADRAMSRQLMSKKM